MWAPGAASPADVLPFLTVDPTEPDSALALTSNSPAVPDLPLASSSPMYNFASHDLFNQKLSADVLQQAHPYFVPGKLSLAADALAAAAGPDFSMGAPELSGISCLNVADSIGRPPVNAQPPPAAPPSPKSSSVCSDEEGLEGSGNNKRQKGGKTRGALAQKRFRERQKERLEDCQKRVKELSDEVKKLKQEKEKLVTHLQVVDIVVQMHIQHNQTIQADEDLQNKSQLLLLDELALFLAMCSKDSRWTGKDLGSMTLSTYTQDVFPNYITRLRQLLVQNPPKVKEWMAARMRTENRRALFSRNYWALACWNRSPGRTNAVPVPAESILVELQLKVDQERALLRAHEDLLTALTKVASDWCQILPTLALELLQVDKAEWYDCAAVKGLTRNLSQEREVVLSFLHRVMFQILDWVQLAKLEVICYPWAPDLCQLCRQLASKYGCKDEHDQSPLSSLTLGFAPLMSLMPHHTAYQILIEPITAEGAGAWLKWALVLDPFITVLPRTAHPVLNLDDLRHSSLLQIGRGSYLTASQRQWVLRHQPTYMSILPETGEPIPGLPSILS